MAGRQIPLEIGLREGATFRLFAAGANTPLLASLSEGLEPFLYLWGAPGSGKSHLLQAACRQTAERGGSPIYLPLADLVAAEAVGMLEGLEGLDLICLDDLESAAGREAWERALFDLYNRARGAGTRLIAAGDLPPSALPVKLPDLRSRLAWGPVFQIQELDEAGRIAALRLHAGARGLELSDEVGQWLLRHCARDLPSLLALLERLDRASLEQKRRLTVPFVREVLGSKAVD